MRTKLIWFVFVFVVLSIGKSARAQSDSFLVEGNKMVYTLMLDSLMDNLDKTRIPDSILYDRVFSFAGLKDTLSATDTVNVEFFIQAYSELQRSDYHYVENDTVFDHRVVREVLYSANRKNEIYVMALNTQFSSIDSNSFSDGRIDTVGRLMFDGSNILSPYRRHRCLVAVLGVVNRIDSGETYKVKFPSYFEMGNTINPISSITIHISADADTLELVKDDSLFLTFNHTGVNIIDITATLSNGNKISFHQTINVTAKIGEIFCAGPLTPITTHLGFQGYDESSVAYGQGEYQIFYHDCDYNLQKPVVIIDGFDPSDDRNIGNIYTNRLKYNYGNLGDELRILGYDVVILNFPTYLTGQQESLYIPPPFNQTIYYDGYRNGGGDFIERNARVLIKLIDDLNTTLTDNLSSEKLVIVGPSMGGQISRYALKLMEDNSWNHNTRLWISFDSPHHGANIPLGFQEMLRYFWKELGNASAKNSYLVQFRSPAARQMLIHQTDMEGPYYQPVNYLTSMWNQQPFRLAWRNTLSSMGFPNDLRKVAVVNGKASGGEFYTPGQDMFLLKGKTVQTGITLFMSTPSFMGTSLGEILNVWQIGQGFIYTFKGLTILPFGAIDACAGSTYDIQDEFNIGVVNGGISNAPWPVGFMTTALENMTHNISFVPTPSSLAMNDPDFDWRDYMDVNSLLCDNKTPFDNIFIPSSNEPHTSLTAKSAAWITQEIVDGDNPCPIICPYIDGVDGLKVNHTATFDLQGIPTGISVNWTVTGGLSILSSTGTDVTVKRISGGTDGIYAHIDNTCGADADAEKIVLTYAGRESSSDSSEVRFENLYNLPKITGNKHGINIYPNPSEEGWNIAVENAGSIRTISAILFDLEGKKVWENATMKGEFRIDNRYLSKGIYCLKIIVNNNVSFHKLTK